MALAHEFEQDPRITYRKLWAHELDLLQDHFLRLDDVTRRMRFSHGVSDTFLRNYAGTALSLNSVIHGCFVSNTLRGVAELRGLFGPLPLEAETAFSVETPWQETGIGTALMDKVILSARNRGISTLHMICLSENARMMRIAKRHGARLKFRAGEIEGQVSPNYPDYLSVIQEMLLDGRGLVSLVLSPPKEGGDEKAG